MGLLICYHSVLLEDLLFAASRSWIFATTVLSLLACAASMLAAQLALIAWVVFVSRGASNCGAPVAYPLWSARLEFIRNLLGSGFLFGRSFACSRLWGTMEWIQLVVFLLGGSTFMFTVGCFLRDQLTFLFFMGILRYSRLRFFILFWVAINIQNLADCALNFIMQGVEIFGEMFGLIIFFGLLLLWRFTSLFAVHNTQKSLVLNFNIQLDILIMPAEIYLPFAWLNVLSDIQHFSYTLSSLISISFIAQNLLLFFYLLTHYLPRISQESD